MKGKNYNNETNNINIDDNFRCLLRWGAEVAAVGGRRQAAKHTCAGDHEREGGVRQDAAVLSRDSEQRQDNRRPIRRCVLERGRHD